TSHRAAVRADAAFAGWSARPGQPAAVPVPAKAAAPHGHRQRSTASPFAYPGQCAHRWRITSSMHDARALINLGTEAVRKLARRGYSLDLASLEELQSRRVQSIRSAEERRAEAKRVAKEVQRTAKEGGDITGLKERARKLKEQIHEVETEQGQIQQELDEFLLDIPN